MADLTFGIPRSISKTPPSHYIFKIQSFSLLAKNNVEIYNSREFQAGGYKWKLILHPNGNKNKNVDDHISLYLMMVVDGSSLQYGWEVHATFRFFLLDQNNDNYLVIQDTVEGGRRFHGLKHEWGIDRLVALKAFENPSNGYLVNNTCVFGAEVYVCQEQVTGKGEYLSMMQVPISYKHTWTIDNFSKQDYECKESTPFNFGDRKWKILLYPKGDGSGAGTHVSLYLALADPTSLPPGSQIHAEFTLRILERDHGMHQFNKAKHWFSASNSFHGWERFVTMSLFQSSNMGFLNYKICYVEAEIIVHGVAKAL